MLGLLVANQQLSKHIIQLNDFVETSRSSEESTHCMSIIVFRFIFSISGNSFISSFKELFLSSFKCRQKKLRTQSLKITKHGIRDLRLPFSAKQKSLITLFHMKLTISFNCLIDVYFIFKSRNFYFKMFNSDRDFLNYKKQ